MRPEIAEAHEQVALMQEVVRTVTDVDTIKALADPTRLAILRSLYRDRVPKSAKELAEDLDQPQTKLYRHLKVLQEAGLIEAAETRVVSGIVETKYRAMQSGVSIDPGENIDATREAMHDIIAGNLNDYRNRMLRAVELDLPELDEESAKKRGIMMYLSATVSEATPTTSSGGWRRWSPSSTPSRATPKASGSRAWSPGSGPSPRIRGIRDQTAQTAQTAQTVSDDRPDPGSASA